MSKKPSGCFHRKKAKARQQEAAKSSTLMSSWLQISRTKTKPNLKQREINRLFKRMRWEKKTLEEKISWTFVQRKKTTMTLFVKNHILRMLLIFGPLLRHFKKPFQFQTQKGLTMKNRRVNVSTILILMTLELGQLSLVTNKDVTSYKGDVKTMIIILI
ncbi:hypothetical protein J6590_069603 [Homalodisca vitripennis]|nr:hypothetical protein J6590_069603 [Homalodisca vitripennis]